MSLIVSPDPRNPAPIPVNTSYREAVSLGHPSTMTRDERRWGILI
jgi:hypothetical protein